MNFKYNSTSQNQFVKWSLHLLIYNELTLSLINVGLPTQSSHTKAYACWPCDYTLMGSLIATR